MSIYRIFLLNLIELQSNCTKKINKPKTYFDLWLQIRCKYFLVDIGDSNVLLIGCELDGNLRK